MPARYLATYLTPAVQQAELEAYGRKLVIGDAPDRDPLGPDEAAFLAARDSFYMATVNADGWPYMQHRGGAPGFLRVIDPLTLGFADLRGNRQLISAGNLAGDGRVALFLMDYAARRRLKLLGRARVLRPDEHPQLAERLSPESRGARVERLILIEVLSFDWNCSAWITPRFTAAEWEAML